MRRRNPLRASARGSGRTVIITTTPDDITAHTADITTAGTRTINFDLVIKTARHGAGRAFIHPSAQRIHRVSLKASAIRLDAPWLRRDQANPNAPSWAVQAKLGRPLPPRYHRL